MTVPKRIILLILFCLLFNSWLISQENSNISVFMPEHENISQVNLNQDLFIEQLAEVIDIFESSFSQVPDEQKVGLYIVFHPQEKASFELFSKPEIDMTEKHRFLEKIKQLNFENTKIVDFPVLISIHVNSKYPERELPGLEFPYQKEMNRYKNSNLADKYKFLKNWAATEVIPVLSAYMTIVSDSFAGVKNYGKTISTLDFATPHNVDELTSKNPDYWRACLEMVPGNELIPVSKIFILISQGKIDYAVEYFRIVSYFSDNKTIAGQYLDELKTFLILFNNDIDQYIQAGIEYHDMEYYIEAIAAFKELLSLYPNSAWATYELYFSENTFRSLSNPYQAEDFSLWYQYKPYIYEKNPMYPMDVHAADGEQAWLLFRRMKLKELFPGDSDVLSDIYETAMIALDLQVWDFAAQLFWYSANYSEVHMETSLYHFLFCLENLKVSSVKENFKGDFPKTFAQIRKDREKAMKDSEIYKSFKK